MTAAGNPTFKQEVSKTWFLRLVLQARLARLALLLVACLLCRGVSQGQQTPPHYVLPGWAPPGAVGTLRLARGGAIAGFFQPVEIRLPKGCRVSLANQGRFLAGEQTPLKVGLLVGATYRLRVTHIPLHEGMEVYPTVEIIDRTYPPAGRQWEFPIIVELTEDDLKQALDGKFVIKVIYLEDPQTAVPFAQHDQQSWFDVPPGKDPLVVADQLGRPVAIVRLGGRLPLSHEIESPQFLFGCPPFLTAPVNHKAGRQDVPQLGTAVPDTVDGLRR